MSVGKKLLVLVAVCTLALLCACSASQNLSNSAIGSSVSQARSENGFPMSDLSGYAGLEDYGAELQYYDLTVKDIEKLMKDGQSFAFIAGFANCPWCNLCVGPLNDAAIAEGVQVGYLDTRLNPEWQSNLDIDDYDTFVDLFGDYLRKDDQDRPHLYTPHVFFIKDGAVVGEHAGTVAEADDPSQPLTEEQVQELTATYREGLASIDR